MHLHGFYFDVLSVGDGERDAAFSDELRPHVFTNRMEVGGTMAMAWAPERAGNWLFDCHMLDHIGPHLRRRPPTAHAEGEGHTGMDHVRDGMAGLVRGITLKPSPNRRYTRTPAHVGLMRLFVQE